MQNYLRAVVGGGLFLSVLAAPHGRAEEGPSTRPAAAEQPVVAGQPKGPMPPPMPDTHPDAPLPAAVSEKVTEERLATNLPLVRYTDVQLGDALDHLSKAGGIAIEADWPKLEKIGLTRDSQVSTRLRNVRCSKVLRTVLDSASAGAVDKPMHVVLPGGRILISTRQDVFDRFTVEQKYDLRDLLRPNDDRGPDGPTLAELQGEIRRLIIEVIAQDTWSAGPEEPGGIITFDGGTMIVRQTHSAHREIQVLINKIRHPLPPQP